MRGVATEFIADTYWIGDDPEDNYRLTRHELLVALWFEATQGQPRFRRRWHQWGVTASQALWRSEMDPGSVELPPISGDVGAA